MRFAVEAVSSPPTWCWDCSQVAADGNEQFHVVVGEELEVEVVFEIRILGFETAHLQERTALVEDAVGHRVVYVYGAGRGVEQARVAFVKADDAIALAQERFGDAAHYCIHAGGRSAAGQNCDCFFHDLNFYVLRTFFSVSDAQKYDLFFKRARKKEASSSR